jgi:hypothetical protein
MRRRHRKSTQGVAGGAQPATFQLLDLLERTSVVRSWDEEPLGVSIPKDRIYGLLGMLGDVRQDLGFKVDYAISDEELFKSVARTLLLTGEMRVLCYARLHSGVEMPSWVPDWRNHLADPCMEKDFFRPAGDLSIQAPKFKDANTISLPCIVVDTITYTGLAWEPETHGGKFNWLAALQLFQEVHALVSEATSMAGLTLDKWNEGIWRIPIADQYTNSLGLRTRAPPTAIEGWLLVVRGPKVLSEDAGAGLDDLNLYQMAMSHLHGRRVIQTHCGFVGLAPVNAEQGDVVVAVPGVGGLLILRPMKGESTFYTIVGEGYLHGIMDGEGAKGKATDWLDVC